VDQLPFERAEERLHVSIIITIAFSTHARRYAVALFHEMVEYWINFVYLAVFFGVMIMYRRLILAQYLISYLHYGVAVIEAAVLAKIILIGDVMRLGRKYEDKPLIVPTFYKTSMFSIFVIGFKIIEHLLWGLKVIFRVLHKMTRCCR